MVPPLIALYSPVMQSGKTEVARTLQLTHSFHPVKFADPFKGFVRDLLVAGGAGEEEADRIVEEGPLKEKPIAALGGVSTRRLLQTLGSDWGRKMVHPDLWVLIAQRKIERLRAAGLPVVVDDLRFPNEYEAIIRLGGTPVKVIRAGTQPYAAHPSEGLLEGYPMMELHNNGTIAQLRACAEQLPSLLNQPR